MSVWAKMQRYADGGMVDEEPEPEDNSAFVAGETGGRDLASAPGVPTAFRAPPNAPRMPAQNVMRRDIDMGQENIGNMREQLQKYLDAQNSGIADLQKLVQQHHGALDRQGQRRNLAPILQLADDNFGGHLSKSYKAPEIESERDFEKIKSQDLLNKERQPVTADLLKQYGVDNSAEGKAKAGYYRALASGATDANRMTKADAAEAKDLGDTLFLKGRNAPPEVRQSVGKLQRATQAIAFMDAIPNTDIRGAELSNVATALAGLVGNGNLVTNEKLQEILPKNLNLTAANWIEWFTSEPHGSDQTKFLARMRREIDAETRAARKAVFGFQTNYANTKEGRMNMGTHQQITNAAHHWINHSYYNPDADTEDVPEGSVKIKDAATGAKAWKLPNGNIIPRK